MNYVLKVKEKFDSAHSLREYNGPCSRLHGHTWHFQVHIKVEESAFSSIGFGIDFGDIKKTIRKEIVQFFDHRYLNDLDIFKDKNPTAENIARYIFETLSASFNREGVSVVAVDLWETENSCVTVSI